MALGGFVFIVNVTYSLPDTFRRSDVCINLLPVLVVRQCTELVLSDRLADHASKSLLLQLVVVDSLVNAVAIEPKVARLTQFAPLAEVTALHQYTRMIS